jgi:hypothetical protein
MMEKGFTYIDNLENLGMFLQERHKTKSEMAVACDELIKGHLDMIALIRSFAVEAEKQIKEWEDEMARNPKVDYRENIDLVRLIIDFYKLNGRYALLELDVNTAYKHLFLAGTEYEYRFFARRAYTLMYEAKKGLAVPMGQMYKRLGAIIKERELGPYKNEHRDLIKFLKTNEEEFKKIRNTNEAHKTEGFDDQVTSIENMSVAQSIVLIEDFCIHLAKLYCSFMVVQNALTAYLKKMMVN